MDTQAGVVGTKDIVDSLRVSRVSSWRDKVGHNDGLLCVRRLQEPFALTSSTCLVSANMTARWTRDMPEGK